MAYTMSGYLLGNGYLGKTPVVSRGFQEPLDTCDKVWVDGCFVSEEIR
jgi:hypothetical protein